MGDWFSADGTLGRDEYTKRVLIMVVLSALIGWVPFFGWTVVFVLAFPLAFAIARRCRTLGLSPWIGLLAFVPIAGLVAAVALIFKD